MARELPIHNGRMTTDLDANGFRIKNLPPGSGFTQVQSDWGQTDTTAPDFIKNKPTIPAPVTIDPALSPTSENPVQNKVVSKALYTGFTEWEFSDGQAHTVNGPFEEYGEWFYSLDSTSIAAGAFSTEAEALAALSLRFLSTDFDITATRHLITPTKTSQLTNDGPSSGPNVGHPFATTNQIPAPVDISGKLDGAAAYPTWDSTASYLQGTVVSYSGRLWKAKRDIPHPPPDAHEPPPDYDDAPWDEVFLKDLKQDALSSAQMAAVNSGATAAKAAAWDGYAAQIAAKANASDVNAALAQKANTADLPYALVTPGKWEFSGIEDWFSVTGIEYLDSLGMWQLSVSGDGWGNDYESSGAATDTSVVFYVSEPEDPYRSATVVATKTGIHLLDRAGNRVVVTGDATLTLPAANPGYLRDFLVRLEISGSTVPTITFQGQGSEAPNGADEIIYETDGDEFPVPDEAGDWLYSFTESCVAHKFAVSLKKVNVVTQGGS